MPVKGHYSNLPGKSHWHVIMVGVQPESIIGHSTAGFDPTSSEYDIYLAHRSITEGAYIRSASFEQIAAFLLFAKSHPNEICRLHKEHKSQDPSQGTLTMDEIVSQHDIHLSHFLLNPPLSANFPIAPSLEPFIFPTYVSDEHEYSQLQLHRREIPLQHLVEALKGKAILSSGYADLEYLAALDKVIGELSNGLPNLIVPFEVGRRKRVIDLLRRELEIEKRKPTNVVEEFTMKNASLMRLVYPIHGSSNFDPVHYCPGGHSGRREVDDNHHYWGWMPGFNGSYVRLVYVADATPSGIILPTRKDQPKEFMNIPGLVCPLHAKPIRFEDGFYIAEVPISNPNGIHLRPSTYIYKCAELFRHYAKDYGSEGKLFIGVQKESGLVEIEAKDILAVQSLGAKYGDILMVRFEAFGNHKNPLSDFRRIHLRRVHRGIYESATSLPESIDGKNP